MQIQVQCTGKRIEQVDPPPTGWCLVFVSVCMVQVSTCGWLKVTAMRYAIKPTDCICTESQFGLVTSLCDSDFARVQWTTEPLKRPQLLRGSWPALSRGIRTCCQVAKSPSSKRSSQQLSTDATDKPNGNRKPRVWSLIIFASWSRARNLQLRKEKKAISVFGIHVCQ